MKRLFGILTMAAVVLALSLQVTAAEKKVKTEAAEAGAAAEKAAATEAGAARALPFQAKVETVDPTAGTFTTTNKKGKVVTFTVNETTTITKNDAPAKITDITVGEMVRGTRTKTGEGQWTVSSLMIGAKDAAAAKPSAARKKEATEEPKAEVKPDSITQ
jgi:type II secretory pathway pseudopilin PulG